MRAKVIVLPVPIFYLAKNQRRKNHSDCVQAEASNSRFIKSFSIDHAISKGANMKVLFSIFIATIFIGTFSVSANAQVASDGIF